jgi:hypothetical protein
MEVLRFCTFATKAEGYDKFATPHTLANFSEEERLKNDPIQCRSRRTKLALFLDGCSS